MTGCLDGFYGPECKKRCSLNCVGGQCEKTFGTCLSGCVDGWNGSMCNEGKKAISSLPLLRQMHVYL